MGSSSIGIIGGADGPTAIFVTGAGGFLGFLLIAAAVLAAVILLIVYFRRRK